MTTSIRPAILSTDTLDSYIDMESQNPPTIEWFYEYNTNTNLYKAIFLIKGQPQGTPGYGKTKEDARHSYILDNDYD